MPSLVARSPSRLASSADLDCPPGEWPQARGHDPRGKFPQRLCRTQYLRMSAHVPLASAARACIVRCRLDRLEKERTCSELASASSAAATSARPISRRRRPFRSSTSRAVADIRPDAAEARGAEFGVPAKTVDGAARRSGDRDRRQPHRPERPCRGRPAGDRRRQARPLGEAARHQRRRSDASSSTRRRRAALRVGCAPDTFLGGAHQTCRKLIDEGAIGQPLAGTAFFMCPGHERWHPDPGFLLPRGRRPDARHGPLLHHRACQPARAGRARRRRSLARRGRERTDHQRAAERHEDPGRGRDPCRRHAGVRLRRGGHHGA